MLTGDHERTAARMAVELHLDEHHSQLLPEQKHALVGALRSRHGPVLMVGDGINDAPALATADVGVAMGAAGSDAALETADVALMSDELLRLPYAIRLARATLRNVRMNVAISLALKAAFLVMAVTGTATLWMAVLSDTGASVIVVGNALRLLRADHQPRVRVGPLEPDDGAAHGERTVGIELGRERMMGGERNRGRQKGRDSRDSHPHPSVHTITPLTRRT
jgi:Cd2+/Zn2+-exporting ATPase